MVYVCICIVHPTSTWCCKRERECAFTRTLRQIDYVQHIASFQLCSRCRRIHFTAQGICVRSAKSARVKICLVSVCERLVLRFNRHCHGSMVVVYLWWAHFAKCAYTYHSHSLTTTPPPFPLNPAVYAHASIRSHTTTYYRHTIATCREITLCTTIAWCCSAWLCLAG